MPLCSKGWRVVNCSVVLGWWYVCFSDVIIEDGWLVDKCVWSIRTWLQLDLWCLGIVNLIHLNFGLVKFTHLDFVLVLLERRKFTGSFLFAMLKWLDIAIFMGCESFLENVRRGYELVTFFCQLWPPSYEHWGVIRWCYSNLTKLYLAIWHLDENK